MVMLSYKGFFFPISPLAQKKQFREIPRNVNSLFFRNDRRILKHENLSIIIIISSVQSSQTIRYFHSCDYSAGLFFFNFLELIRKFKTYR